MDVARLNMSHGSHEDHDERLPAWCGQASDATGHGVGILADLQGPKIRLETFADGPVQARRRATEFTITTRDVDGRRRRSAGRRTRACPATCTAGDPILIDDGKVRLRVIEVGRHRRRHAGSRSAARSATTRASTCPASPSACPALSEKDIDDLRWALRTCASTSSRCRFVRSAADVDDVRAIMREEGVLLPVIAKIEKPQAIDNLDEIVDGVRRRSWSPAATSAWSARSRTCRSCRSSVIDKARRNAKPVIVATQMLESMITNPRPTRAEASDVANAVLDGADAVMLSGETSVGEYPIETVETMARIIASTEDHELAQDGRASTGSPRTRGGVIAKAAAEVAERVGAKYLVAFTQSGDSARRLSRYRGPVPVLAFTPEAKVRSPARR